MIVHIDEHSDYHILHVEGSIDLDHLEVFNDAIVSMLDLGLRNLIIDFSKVNFISMVGVGALVAVYDQLKEKSGLGLSGVSSTVHEIFEVSKFVGLFSFYTDNEQATKALVHQSDERIIKKKSAL